MKYIKNFENIQEKPKIGDYVLLNPDKLTKGYIIFKTDENKKDFNEFIDNNFGKIKHFHYSGQMIIATYDIEPSKDISNGFIYDNVSNKYTVSTYVEDIVEFAKSPEELKLKIISKKYNL